MPKQGETWGRNGREWNFGKASGNKNLHRETDFKSPFTKTSVWGSDMGFNNPKTRGQRGFGHSSSAEGMWSCLWPRSLTQLVAPPAVLDKPCAPHVPPGETHNFRRYSSPKTQLLGLEQPLCVPLPSKRDFLNSQVTKQPLNPVAFLWLR